MARRTREELIAEIARVDAALRIWDAFLTEELDDYAPIDLEPVEDFIAHVTEYGYAMSEALSGYQQALNDFQISLTDRDMGQPGYSQRFFAFYRAQTGRSYIDDFGDPLKAVRRVLRRGAIADEAEYYLLHEIVIDTAQTILKPKEVAQANRIIGEYLEDIERKIAASDTS